MHIINVRKFLDAYVDLLLETASQIPRHPARARAMLYLPPTAPFQYTVCNTLMVYHAAFLSHSLSLSGNVHLLEEERQRR